MLVNKRTIVGILVITIIFFALSILSSMSLFEENSGTDNSGEQTELAKTDYMKMLETEYGITFTTNDDFANLSMINDELIIIPANFKYYQKPCFDFTLDADGVVITNSLGKEFYLNGFSVGKKITKINDEVLAGKTYLEIIDLIYAKNLGEEKKFEFNDQSIITYKYVSSTPYEYDGETNTLYIYNLDDLKSRAIYDIWQEHSDMTLDLSKATVTKYDGILNFLSLFSAKDANLFVTPSNVTGQKIYKITNLKIVANDNMNKGINFALNFINNLKKDSITISSNIQLTETNFNVVKILESSSYLIYVKNYKLSIYTETIGSGGVLV